MQVKYEFFSQKNGSIQQATHTFDCCMPAFRTSSSRTCGWSAGVSSEKEKSPSLNFWNHCLIFIQQIIPKSLKYSTTQFDYSHFKIITSKQLQHHHFSSPLTFFICCECLMCESWLRLLKPLSSLLLSRHVLHLFLYQKATLFMQQQRQ